MDILDLTAVWNWEGRLEAGRFPQWEAVRLRSWQIEAVETSCHAFIQIDREGR